MTWARQPCTWQPSLGRHPQWRSCIRQVLGCTWQSGGATQPCTWPAVWGHMPVLVCCSSPVPGVPGEHPTLPSLRALTTPPTPTTALLPCTPKLTWRRKMRVKRIGSCSWRLKTTRATPPSMWPSSTKMQRWSSCSRRQELTSTNWSPRVAGAPCTWQWRPKQPMSWSFS
ncbi:hypothetical protein MC885_007561 [Smutsia gigantea]|nr:hypothetical protein MC885_007561 [Smutsia gigantea]